ncbi:MAG: hypothetical protein Q4D85_12215, partial [Corynebacterium sp.]|uniref:hypothetical protein n=1 Tax=Corynebacterium sp. TaxID=1720 RepID=UPI0026DBA46D
HLLSYASTTRSSGEKTSLNPLTAQTKVTATHNVNTTHRLRFSGLRRLKTIYPMVKYPTMIDKVATVFMASSLDGINSKSLS